MPISLFIESYNRANIQVTDEEFKNQSLAIDNLALIATPEQALTLARLYLGKPVESDAEQDIRNAIRKFDSKFLPRNATEQLRIIAGETICQMMSLDYSPARVLAALAIFCNPDQSNEEIPVEHLRQSVVDYLADQGNTVRTIESYEYTHASLSFGKTDKLSELVDVIKELKIQNENVKKIEISLRNLAEQQEFLAYQQTVASEETSILWYMQVKTCVLGFSSDVGIKYPLGGAVVIAWELAGLTEFIVPPVSYKHLVKACLNIFGIEPEARTTISKSFLQLDKEHLDQLSNPLTENPAIDLCPTIMNIKNLSKSKKKEEDISLADLTCRCYLEYLMLLGIKSLNQ